MTSVPVTVYALPLEATPQRLSINLLGVSYNLQTRWSAAQGAWLLDIRDADNNLIYGPIPLVTGADLLGQVKYLNIGGALIIQNTAAPIGAVPNFTSLGLTAQVVFLPYSS